ncbi:DNA-binding protein [Neptuniibacter sp.]|uniref:DNA-binding protein n=1 Tax=Neptuniibacter sp. TaxID=1962643 RepID=UPI002634523A|nr:DNA-binding protein [Neptuniibacter sp.]MCP4595372.1 hypothetical protein [Neptuniibacter sp.]
MAINTQELAKKAADELLMEGVRPTQQNVRDRLGSGSITTINKALSAWWLELGERLKANSSHPMIPDPVAESASKLWVQALAYAEQSLEERRHKLESDYRKRMRDASEGSKEDQQELKELRSQCLRLLQDNERLNDGKLELQLKLAESENGIMSVRLKNESLERELKQLNAAGKGGGIDEYIELQVSNRTLKEENKRLSKQIDTLVTEKSSLQLEIARLEQQNQDSKSV